MTDLIARLEAATEGSRELDKAIWLEIGESPMKLILCPHYTTSIDAALPGEDIHRVERVQSPTVTWWKAYQGIHIGQGKTEALARRIAALKARRKP